MEIFDICDENGQPIGKTVERDRAHAEGICHRTAHIWIIREKNGIKQIILQKRSMNKDSFPGRFDTSSAGHITAGDEPIKSAIRELQEELGIYADESELQFLDTFRINYEKIFHDKPFRDNEIAFVFVYNGAVDESKLMIQEEEVDCVQWFDFKYVYEECKKHNQNFCVPIKSLEILKKYLGE